MERGLRLGLKRTRKRSNIYNRGDYSPLLKKGKDGQEKRLKTNHEDRDVDISLNKKKRSKTTSGFGLRKCGSGLRKCSQPQVEDESYQLTCGDRVNLLDLLFTKHRDYLVTYSNRNRPIHAKQLEGKFILLQVVPLVPWSDWLWLIITSLVDIYNSLQPKGGFEVVFIGVKYGKYASRPKKLRKSFEEMLSIMPWTAVPDIKSLRYWERKLRFPISNDIGECSSCTFVIDPTGVLLSCGADYFFARYGVEGFPFTEERMDLLDSQGIEAQKHPSITSLLTSPERDYLINNKGQEVPVHSLEEKVVALYFFQEYPYNGSTQEFKAVYQQLANAQNFEIVLVYVHDSLATCAHASEEKFWAHFDEMPWLALPFKDPKVKSLQRIFCTPMDLSGPGPDSSLVIVGPRGEFFEPYAADMLVKFGSSAYPFSRTRVAEIEAEFARNLKLDTIFDPNTSFTQENGPNIKLSQLLGKRIIIIVDGVLDNATPMFWQELRTRYLQMKDTDAKFQVIHIHRNEGPQYGEHVGSTTSWLRHHPFHEESRISKLLVRLFRRRIGLLAFDCDGRVVRKTFFPSIEEGNMDFPFHAGDLEEVVLADLVKLYDWDYFWFD